MCQYTTLLCTCFYIFLNKYAFIFLFFRFIYLFSCIYSHLQNFIYCIRYYGLHTKLWMIYYICANGYFAYHTYKNHKEKGQYENR